MKNSQDSAINGELVNHTGKLNIITLQNVAYQCENSFLPKRKFFVYLGEKNPPPTNFFRFLQSKKHEKSSALESSNGPQVLQISHFSKKWIFSF